MNGVAGRHGWGHQTDVLQPPSSTSSTTATNTTRGIGTQASCSTLTGCLAILWSTPRPLCDGCGPSTTPRRSGADRRLHAGCSMQRVSAQNPLRGMKSQIPDCAKMQPPPMGSPFVITLHNSYERMEGPGICRGDSLAMLGRPCRMASHSLRKAKNSPHDPGGAVSVEPHSMGAQD